MITELLQRYGKEEKKANNFVCESGVYFLGKCLTLLLPDNLIAIFSCPQQTQS